MQWPKIIYLSKWLINQYSNLTNWHMHFETHAFFNALSIFPWTYTWKYSDVSLVFCIKLNSVDYVRKQEEEETRMCRCVVCFMCEIAPEFLCVCFFFNSLEHLSLLYKTHTSKNVRKKNSLHLIDYFIKYNMK